ncbi:hypothetical protein INR49_019246 [Caranx melampygus]|nr:hypothetical protein INR49_019246 [Caranx melampygus]
MSHSVWCKQHESLDPSCQEIMEYAETILSIASEIHKLYETVKDNKETCHRVLERVKSLEQLAESIKKRDTVRVSEEVERSLKEVIDILKAARELVKKCTTDNWFKRVTRAFKRKEDLRILIERINDGFRQLSVAMQLEHGTGIYMVYEKVSREKDDEAARRKDDKALKDLIEKNMREQPEKLEQIKSEVEKLIEKLSQTQDNGDSIRMIKLDELEYDKEPFMETQTSKVYKGKYRRFQVAIKRYMQPVNRSPRSVPHCCVLCA